MKSSNILLLLSLFSLLCFPCLAGEGDGGQVSPEKESENSAVENDGMSDIWTNWYRFPELLSLINLAVVRDRLNKHNLVSVYREFPNTVQGRKVSCGEREQRVRTNDGSCNSLEYPVMGAVGTAFGRNVAVEAVVKNRREKIMDPSPHEISQKLLKRDTFKPVPFLNFWAASWLQFMNHDWFFHGKNSSHRPHRMRTSDGTIMKIPRTKQADSHLKGQAHKELPKGKIFGNQVTHWWDGSQIYGSDADRVEVVRLHRGGKLKIDQKSGLLSVDGEGIEEVGFKDNWWVGLSLLHHLFVKEHNAIAEALAKKYPQYDDQRLYDIARLVNAAVMAKIHTVEWTPAILPNKTLNWAMHTNWYGALNPEAVKIVSDTMAGEDNFILAEEDAPPFLEALRQQFGASLSRLLAGVPAKTNHSETTVDTLGDLGGASMALITGMVGAQTELFDVPYAITEEFVAVYRMHPLIPEDMEIRSMATDQVIERVPINDTRHEKSMPLLRKHGLATLFYSFGRSHPGSLSLRNYPVFMTDMEVPENPEKFRTVDLAALEIIRDRERGVPRYNEFRRQIGLRPIRKFEDLFVDENRPETASYLDSPQAQDLLQELKKIYRNDVEKLDLLVGTLGENIRPDNFGFGETAFQIFILMATRRLQADRFYTEDYNSETYTQLGLDWVDQATFRGILLRHFPQLQPHLEGVANAFNPWKTATLDEVSK